MFQAGKQRVEAVRGVDLDVQAGELVGFLGPNGSGKTTTLRMLTTLLLPTGGEATVAGHDVVSDPRAVRRHIGYVAQAGGAGDDCPVGDELTVQGRLYGLSATTARARGAQVCERLGIGGLDRRIVRTLSGGQRRRLDIAMSLIHEPPLVFLDEPSTGLDPQSRADLWEHIRDLRDRNGTTVFLTTHYLDEADALCDRILVMDGGRIVAEGTPESLKAQVKGDAVDITVPEADVPEARALVRRQTGRDEVDVDHGRIRVRVLDGAAALPPLLRELDRCGITAGAVTVQRPTLDDVFLTMTGRTLRGAEQTN